MSPFTIATEWIVSSCRRSAGPAVMTERIITTADGIIWLVLWVQTPVYHNKLQATVPFNQTPWIHSNGEITPSNCKQIDVGCQSDVHVCKWPDVTDNPFLSWRVYFTLHWRDYCVAFFIILTGFRRLEDLLHLIPNIGSLSSSLTVIWMGNMSKQHEFMHICI